MSHDDFVKEFYSYPKEVQEIFYKCICGDGYDAEKRSVELFRFFRDFFENFYCN